MITKPYLKLLQKVVLQNLMMKIMPRYLFRKKRFYVWSKEDPKICRTRTHNIIIRLPGTKNEAKNVRSMSPEPELIREERCHIFNRQVDKKTKVVCKKCKIKHICPDHRNSEKIVYNCFFL